MNHLLLEIFLSSLSYNLGSLQLLAPFVYSLEGTTLSFFPFNTQRTNSLLRISIKLPFFPPAQSLTRTTATQTLPLDKSPLSDNCSFNLSSGTLFCVSFFQLDTRGYKLVKKYYFPQFLHNIVFSTTPLRLATLILPLVVAESIP